MEGTGLASVIQLVEGTGGVTLEQILEYRVMEECLSLFKEAHDRKAKISKVRKKPVESLVCIISN